MLLTPTCEGRIHDKRIADATRYCLPNGSTLFQDSGFQGFSLQGINIIQPKKKPKGRDLTLEEKREESSYFIHPCPSRTCDEWYQKIPHRKR